MNKEEKNLNNAENPKLGISDVMHSDYQQKIFHEIVGMKHRMQGLAGFVQNDFERMLEDGTTTKDGIKEAIEDMDKSFDKVVNEMNTLREKCRVIMSYHCA
jgi:ribosome recycling factor